MNKEELENLYLKLCSLSIFKGVVNSSLFSNFFLIFEEKELNKKLRAYSSFANEIYEIGGNLSTLVKKLILEDENVYIHLLERNLPISDSINAQLNLELELLKTFSLITSTDIKNYLNVNIDLPSYEKEEIDFKNEYFARIKEMHKYGYGIFATSTMFRLDDNKQIVPILSQDKTSLESFFGYEEERNKLIHNTQNFMANKEAFNVLLYGDAGTGKSSSVKATVNHFSKDGLRLIELRKSQICDLPLILDKIRDNPLKFIIFIDDLSFNKNDDNFAQLKAILEGSASSKTSNALIYCTSNRRHLIKENLEDREGNELHLNDTIQETLSLVERFGLTIAYYKPDKKLYLSIVHELIKEYNIEGEEASLDIKAEEFALRKGSRSPRCARQFIKSLL